MHIVAIEIIRIAIPYNDDKTGSEQTVGQTAQSEILTGFSANKVMETLLVKATTDTGHVGWGEAFGHLINSATYAALADSIAPFFIGATIDTSNADTASSRIEEAHKAFHLFGRTGPALYAISAIDIALWDLKAQACGQPLFQLLGGSRNQIDTYASLVPYNEDIPTVLRNTTEAYATGFRSIKLHETKFETIKAARDSLPSDCRLMVDVNCVWPPEEAAHQAARLKELGLYWLEEPVWPPDDFESLASVRKLGVPLAAGENASGIDGYERYLKANAVDIIQPSIIKLGGLTTMLKAYRLGRQYNVQVQPHCFFYGAGMLATAHVVAAMDETAFLEVPWIEFSALLMPEAKFGPRCILPETPGLGFNPDPDVMERYRVAATRIQ